MEGEDFIQVPTYFNVKVFSPLEESGEGELLYAVFSFLRGSFLLIRITRNK